MPIAINEKGGYVVIPLLPIEQQTPFKKWIFTQTAPIIPEQGIHQYECAYLHDHQRWLLAWVKGEIPEIMD